jgi:hypothetical protein
MKRIVLVSFVAAFSAPVAFASTQLLTWGQSPTGAPNWPAGAVLGSGSIGPTLIDAQKDCAIAIADLDYLPVSPDEANSSAISTPYVLGIKCGLTESQLSSGPYLARLFAIYVDAYRVHCYGAIDGGDLWPRDRGYYDYPPPPAGSRCLW